MSNFYPNTMPDSEVDLREQMQALFYGTSSEIPKGQTVIFRKMRRKSGIVWPVEENDLEITPAINSLTHQGPTPTYPDNWAFGEKFLFDDQLVRTYHSRPIVVEAMNGTMPLPLGVVPLGTTYFYLEYWVMPSIYDKIIELVINEQGVPVSPIKQFMKYHIHSAEPFRSDNGRIEFWRCIVHQ